MNEYKGEFLYVADVVKICIGPIPKPGVGGSHILTVHSTNETLPKPRRRSVGTQGGNLWDVLLVSSSKDVDGLNWLTTFY